MSLSGHGVGLGALIMLISAVFHAFMTLSTKQAKDMLVFRAVSMGFSVLWLSPILFLFPFPPWGVWRYLILSSILVWAYNMLMIAAFKRGDMNLVYPVMRGAAPALAAFIAFFTLKEGLSVITLTGLAIVSLALIAFAWPEKGGAPKMAALGFALCAATMTASYSVNDAAGARLAQSPLLYTAWFFVLCALSLCATAIWMRRGSWLEKARGEVKLAFRASFFNVGTYGSAMIAYSMAPVAPMAALRETSIVFGAVLAALVLKEPLGRRRIALACLLASGLVLLQVGLHL